MRIGSPESDHIRFQILRRQYPGSRDYWDGNWLATRVQIRGGGVRGRLDTEIHAEDFSTFLAALERMETEPSATATLKPLETVIRVDVARAKDGLLVASCEATPSPKANRHLYFTIRFDDQNLVRIINELGQIVRDYPIVGKK